MKKHSQLFKRILSYFLMLTMLIGIVVGITYFSFVKQQENDFVNQMRDNIDFVHEDFSQYTHNIAGIYNLFLSVPFVIKGYHPNMGKDADDRIIAKDIIDLLNSNLNAAGEDVIIDIFTYIDDEDVISIRGMSDNETFFSSSYHFDAYDSTYWVELLHGEFGMKILNATRVRRSNSAEMIVLPIVNLSYNNGNMCAYVALCSVEALARKYEQAAVLDDSIYIVLDKDGKVLYDRSGLFSDWPENAALADSSVSVRGVSYRMIVEEYAPFGWRVLCLTPFSAILRLGEFYIVIASALCIGLLLLSLVLSYAFSRSIYRPIFNLHQDILGTMPDAEALNSGNELSDISRNLRAIVESTTTDQDWRHMRSQQYAKARILEILNGHFITDEQNLLETLQEEFGFCYPYIGCALYESTQYIHDIPPDIRTMWIAHRSGVLICVYNQQSVEIPSALDATACRHGVGRPYDNLHGICTSFESAANQFVGLPVALGECAFQPSAFAVALRRRNASTACEMIDVFVQQLRERWPGYCAARTWIQSVYETCIHTIGVDLYRYCDALRMEAESYMDILLSREGISAQPLMHFVRMVADLMPEQHNTKNNYDLAQRIRAYIDLHYFEPLSLAILADQMGVSDKYVSHVFKEEFQVNVSDYIAMVRVEHAKQLLSKGIAVNAAAQQVGIDSRATFIRMFKKIEGVTPSEFANHTL